MLPKHLRLQSEFISPLARHGKYVKGEYFDLAYSKADDAEAGVQFGISISRGIDKRAAVRNRIKRRLRAAIIKLNKEMEIPVGQYLVIVRSPDLGKKEIDVYQILLEALIHER